MNWDDLNFHRVLREAMREVVEELCRKQPMHGQPMHVEELKVTEMPKFIGGTDPNRYLDWKMTIEIIFELKGLDDVQSCKYMIVRLHDGVSSWFEGLKAKRNYKGKKKISSLESLKCKLRKKYMPTTYRKIIDMKQGFGDIQHDWLNKRMVSIVEDVAIRDEVLEEEKLGGTSIIKEVEVVDANTTSTMPNSGMNQKMKLTGLQSLILNRLRKLLKKLKKLKKT